jgi:SHS2 domain-containing protein
MIEAPAGVEPRVTQDIHIDSPLLDLLYYAFLQELLYYKDAQGLLLVPGAIEVCERGGHWFCSCTARGEAIDLLRHDFITDVKAVTLHGLEVKRDGDGWTSTVVVDV